MVNTSITSFAFSSQFYRLVTITRALLFCLATFSTSFCAQAQSDTIRQSSIELLGGAINNRIVDTGLSFNRQAFTGTSFKFFGAYDRRRNRNMLLASFEINGGKLKMSDEQVLAKITNGQIAASYLFMIAPYKILGKETRLYLGPKFGTNINYINAPSLDNETLIAVYGLYLHAFQHIQLNKSSFLDASVSLPTLSFSNRMVMDGGLYQPENDEPPGILFEDLVFSFTMMMEFNATYSKRLTRLTYFNVRYRFAYLSSNDFGDMKIYSNELLAGFKFYFKYE